MKYLLSFIGTGLLLITGGCGGNTSDSSTQEAPSIPAGKTAEALEPIPAAEPFTIAFAGDTMFDWDLRPVLDEHGYDYPFEYVHNEAEVVDINGRKVAFLSFTRFFPDFSWAAQSGRPGVTNGYDLDFVIETIQAHEQSVEADHLVVNFHWGVEKTNTPAAYQHEYVERIVDETGTDAIVGAHPHWLQGFEFYEGVPVAYSLGNFLFPDYVSGHSAETGVLHMTFSEEDIDLSFAPYHLTNNQIVPLQGKEKQKMFQYLEDISINAEIDEYGHVTES